MAACSATKGQITGRDADPAAVPDLAGEYAVNGSDRAGSEYGGRLSIRPGEAAGHYRLQWIVNESIQEGAGAVEGNKLAVMWQSAPGQSAQTLHGVATYTITDKGEFYGTRTVDGAAGDLWKKGVSQQEKVARELFTQGGWGDSTAATPSPRTTLSYHLKQKTRQFPRARSPTDCAPSATRDSASGYRTWHARRLG